MMIMPLGQPRVFDGDVERGFTGTMTIAESPTGEPILIDRHGGTLPPPAQRTKSGAITLNVPVPTGDSGTIPPATAPTTRTPTLAAVPEQDAPDLALGRRPTIAAASTPARGWIALALLGVAAVLFLAFTDDE